MVTKVLPLGKILTEDKDSSEESRRDGHSKQFILVCARLISLMFIIQTLKSYSMSSAMLGRS